MQYWLLERKGDDGVRYMYFCNADGRETAKRLAQSFLLGNPDEYTVTPISDPGDTVSLQINVGSAPYRRHL